MSTERIISPPKSEFTSLRQPLEDGEMRVFEFFDKYLPQRWEIYVQPHLNGLRPDFVLLHPEVGIAVHEVKNWDLDAMERWVEERSEKPPILKGRKDGKEFSLQRDNPVEKVFRYKQEIQNLYCPRIDQRSGLAVVTAGVIFPSADDERVAQLLQPCRKYRNMQKWHKYNPISGKNAIVHGDLLRVFPEAKRSHSNYMSADLAADLRLWLVEPDASKTQRTPLELDKTQKKLATSRTNSGYRRITGPAGSGKSVVLAARAAQLISEGKKDVLVVAFNITLLNYLADAAVRNYRSSRKAITWLNFHHWCKRICDETDHSEEYRALWSDEGHFPDRELCTLVKSIIDKDTQQLIQRYDAVLVDEGQDFQPQWWALLRMICKPGGEMLFVADATQDVYGTAHSWTDDVMRGAGFAGNWTKLGVSYRLPSGFIGLVRDFGTRFLPQDNVDLPPPIQFELVNPCQLRWVQVGCGQTASTAVEELWGLTKSHNKGSLSVSDLTVLVDSQELGQDIVSLLSQSGARCINTFEKDKKLGRRKKLAFFMGDARIKVTTLHSFKGWETRTLLICIKSAKDHRTLALFYAGLTRLKKHQKGSFLIVVCGEPKLAEYGRSWPDFTHKIMTHNT